MVSSIVMPMLPFPNPIFCAPALRLCNCNRVVADAELPLACREEASVSDPAEVSAGAADEEDTAKVAVVEVAVTGRAEMPVGVIGEVVATVGVTSGDVDDPATELMLETLLVEP